MINSVSTAVISTLWKVLAKPKVNTFKMFFWITKFQTTTTTISKYIYKAVNRSKVKNLNCFFYWHCSFIKPHKVSLLLLVRQQFQLSSPSSVPTPSPTWCWHDHIWACHLSPTSDRCVHVLVNERLLDVEQVSAWVHAEVLHVTLCWGQAVQVVPGKGVSLEYTKSIGLYLVYNRLKQIDSIYSAKIKSWKMEILAEATHFFLETTFCPKISWVT